jgi:hypothetical protein
MKARIGMMVMVGSVLWLGSCGSDDESSDDANRGGGGSRAPEEMCPAERPMDGDSCKERGAVCEYDDGNCTCNAASMGGFGEIAWDCPFQIPQGQMCPPQAPQPGSACMNVFGECPYGSDKICDCADDTDTWSCWNPADCPMTPPENMSACDPVGMECEYDDTMMECDCTSEGWDCDMDPF